MVKKGDQQQQQSQQEKQEQKGEGDVPPPVLAYSNPYSAQDPPVQGYHYQQQHMSYGDVYQQSIQQGAYGYQMDWGQHQQMMHQQQQQQQQHGYAAIYGGYHYPLHHQQHMEGVPLPPGIPGLGGSTDPLEAVLGTFPCTRLRGLPYDTSLEDILLLFQGLVVIDVVLVGQGEAFVVFANPMDFQMALQRDRQTIGRRFIEITQASRADYYEAIADQHYQEQQGRPHSRTSLKSSNLSIGESNFMGSGDDKLPSGDTASAVAALWGGTSVGGSTQSMHTLGGYESMHQQHQLHHQLSHQQQSLHHPHGMRSGRGGMNPPPLQKRTGGGIQVGEHTGFLRMRGLPFSAAKEDIYRFFESYNPVLESIVLTYRNDGRATGEAYVGFASPDDSRRAMDLHRRSMGSRYIELFISNKEEHSRALARFGGR